MAFGWQGILPSLVTMSTLFLSGNGTVCRWNGARLCIIKGIAHGLPSMPFIVQDKFSQMIYFKFESRFSEEYAS